MIALALLATQALGLQHRTAHAPGPSSLAGLAHSPDTGHVHAAASVGEAMAHGDTGLFGHDAGHTSQCRLYDQLSLADLLTGDTPQLVTTEAPCRAIDSMATAHARTAVSVYQARAPPAHA